jgi:ectoine hydroxylase-related dioxygenase (phytanoyl-CoA dioxygenase family)
MCVLPGCQNGQLPIRRSADDLFDEEIDPSSVPDDFESSAVQFRFPAGGMAIHHTMIPHTSFPNKSDRWRRVLVLRYMAAGGTLGAKQYEDYRNGEPFDRKYYVVRGEDNVNRGLPTQPPYLSHATG